MTRRITVADLLDNPVSDAVQDAGAQALAHQGWFARRKNTITAAAQVVLQVLNLLAFSLADVHWGVTVAVAVVIGVGEVIIHAATKGPVTPSAVEKIRVEAQKQADVSYLVDVDEEHTEPARSTLPVYDGPTSSQG